jgi:antirestriction protein ArdC
MAKKSVFDIVTAKIIEKLESGNIPWVKPWNAVPCNYESERPYSGVNLLLLFAEYGSPFWMTWRQIQRLGGHVRKGERASLIVFWKRRQVKKTVTLPGGEAREEVDEIPYLRYYHVFNLEQCEGIPAKQHNPAITKCDDVIDNCPVRPVITAGLRAAYSPGRDLIIMPARDTFTDNNGYYSTLFHEVVHWTGHESRLSRFKPDDAIAFGNETYSREELVAELGSAFLCALTGIENNRLIENSAAYVRHWITVLKNDKKLIVQAAGDAQRAVSYITGKQNNEVAAPLSAPAAGVV